MLSLPRSISSNQLRPAFRLISKALCLALWAAFCAAGAQVLPIPLTPDSFTHDIIVERTAPGPVLPATTASMDAGLGNTGYSWYEKGYYEDWPATGLPYAGSTITSDVATDHQYQFAPDYRSNNAVLIDSTLAHAELVFSNPAPLSALSFLLSGANDSLHVPVACSVRFQDGSAESSVLHCPDWLDNTYSAYSANGRVEVTIFTFRNLNGLIPKLFSEDIQVTNRSGVTGVDLDYAGGTAHCAVLAVSGAAEAGGGFSPIRFRGYNVDMVVEAGAVRPGWLRGITSGTMQSGQANVGRTFYEAGYMPLAPDTGLPAPGTFLTNAAVPGEVYLMPPDYRINNAALLDANGPSANLVPTSPGPWQALCLLTAAAGGPVTNHCVVQHADGTSETNAFVSPDWLDTTTPAAIAVNGRVNVDNRMLDNVNSGAPRLFGVQVTLTNSESAVTNIVVSGGGRAVILAVSGVPPGGAVSPGTLSIRTEQNGAVVIESSAPGRLEYTTALDGVNTVWVDAGAISGSVTVVPQAGETGRFYRVRY